jgi:hypothetical protein
VTVENFQTAAGLGVQFPDDPFAILAYTLDPSGFSAPPLLGEGTLWTGLPDNAIGDFAVGLDYTLFASGIGTTVDPLLGARLSGFVPGL